MKHILLVILLSVSTLTFSQVLDVFNYSGALNANGWTTHSGTAGQLNTLTTASDAGNSLSYAGLVASTGNRATLVAGNGEDVNKALTGVTGTGYYSFLLKVNSTTGIAAAGDYFTGFGATAGASVTVLAARTFIKPGVAPGTFVLGIQNATTGSPTQTYTSTEYPVGTTVMVVVKLNTTTSPVQASLFVNPVPGSVEPAATVTNASGTAAFPTMASVFFRENGTAGSGTGTLEIDEIRTGTTWAAVTPSGCATTSTLNITNCGAYTLNSQTYATSGTYTQVLTNGNAAGCDSTITLHLTVNNPTTSSITTSSCGAYTLNGTTYSTSGTYTQVLTNAAGCDSTITLDLSIVASIVYYADVDGDGLGDASSSVSGCSQPAGYVTNSNDCDDSDVNVGLGSVYYADADSDGFGDASVTQTACTMPAGYVSNNTDCDDSNAAVGVAQSWYADADGDGFGSASATAVVACTAPANHVLDNTDCNDANAAAHPGAAEIPNNGVDEDCNGSDLNTLGTQLAQYTFTGNNCMNPVHSVTTQPANATFSDYASDSVSCATGNDIFNYSGWNTGTTIDTTEYYQFTITPDHCYSLDLTSLTFLHRVSASGGTPFVYVRSSLDNFTTDVFSTQIAAPGTSYTENVMLPPAFASITDSVTFRFYIVGIAGPGATYRQDNVSVTGSIDPLPQQTYYADADGDGFGDATTTTMDCTAPQGYVSDNTDCNDNSAAENPNAVWYADADSDGFGNSAQSLTQCTQPVGYVSNNTDCNDSNATVTGSTTYYADADGDGFGDAGSSVVACSTPAGYVTNNTDCDDSDSNITIANTQYYIDADGDGFGSTASVVTACTAPAGYVANSTDCDDNDSSVGLPANVYYQDADSDGFGDETHMMIACTQPAGYVSDNTDCNDNNASVNPDATDINGNSIDENCDGVDGNLGIDEFDNAAVVVFPNPGSAFVNVNMTGSWNNSVAVTIRSIDGKIVQSTEVALVNGTAQLSTTELLPSVYFIQVTDGAHKAIVRWVKN